MCAWMKLHPSKDDLKLEPYKSVFEEISQKMISQQTPKQSEKPFLVPNYKSPDKNLYIEQLRKQIEQNRSRCLVEKTERKSPGIDQNFSGYPDRPQTPNTIRRQIELNKMKKLKMDLDQQINSKSKLFYSQHALEKNSIDELIKEDLQKMNEMSNKITSKKDKQRNLLTESWSDAISKKIGNKIGVNDSCLAASERSIIEHDVGKGKYNESSFFSKDSFINVRESREIRDISAFDSKISKIIETAKKTRSFEKSFMSMNSHNSIIKGGRKHFSTILY